MKLDSEFRNAASSLPMLLLAITFAEFFTSRIHFLEMFTLTRD